MTTPYSKHIRKSSTLVKPSTFLRPVSKQTTKLSGMAAVPYATTQRTKMAPTAAQTKKTYTSGVSAFDLDAFDSVQ